jgi:hypothetical protein
MLSPDIPLSQGLQAEYDRLRPRPQGPRISQVWDLLDLRLREAEPEQPLSFPAGRAVHARIVRPALGPHDPQGEADRLLGGAPWDTFRGIVT